MKNQKGRTPSSHLWLLLVVVALVAAACGSSGETAASESSQTPTQPGSPQTGESAETETPDAPTDGRCTANPIASTQREDTVSGLDAIFPGDWSTLVNPLLEQDKIVPVLGPDGIPAVDSPKCTLALQVDFMATNEAIISVDINGEVRGYPVQILTWHELVNDTVGGVPVTVAYCPLCNSALTYDRRIGDRILDFGTSGSLHQSSLVMYDRQTETLWTHFDGKAVAGELAGTQLEFYSTAVVSWEQFVQANPNAMVLNQDTGNPRDYGRNPYQGYEQSSDALSASFLTNEVDPRLPPKEKVIGIWSGDTGVAVLHTELREQGVVAVDLAGEPLVVFNLPGAASALDANRVADGIDVGSSGVFSPIVDGSELTFERTETGFVDIETGSTWNIFGVATDGELVGAKLEARPFLDTFWFAWGTFVEGSAIA